MITAPQAQPDPTPAPMIADNFAGGGGASTGIEMALGRSPDVAINHDPVALQMHEANHGETNHIISSIYDVDPRDLVQPGQPVGLAWFSPDCKHHSKAKGGKPVDKNIRGLAWVAVDWAMKVRPRMIALENVEEFKDWGPLTAENRPCKRRKGVTFDLWVRKLRQLGYQVEWRELRACDYGAPTIRKRLFVLARCDGRPIVWPEPTHGAPGSLEVAAGTLKPYRTAADIIDWSLPCPSIFMTPAEAKKWRQKTGQSVKRPLSDNTLRRIARGIQRYVIEAEQPFFVTYAQQGGAVRSAFDPLHTVTASHKDQNAIIMPTMVQTGYGERKGQEPRALDIHKPIGTMVAGGTKHALVAAFLAQHNGGPRMENNAGRPVTSPLSTLTERSTQQQLVAANMISMRGTQDAQLKGADIRNPVPTISAGGGHAALVSAFMIKYYGTAIGHGMDQPTHSVTTRDRFGMVTVMIDGEEYAITDIGMRMLTPREQFRAQGFPDSYQIDRGADGRELTKTEQIRMCGNSVAPPLAAALVKANCPELINA